MNYIVTYWYWSENLKKLYSIDYYDKSFYSLDKVEKIANNTKNNEPTIDGYIITLQDILIEY